MGKYDYFASFFNTGDKTQNGQRQQPKSKKSKGGIKGSKSMAKVNKHMNNSRTSN